MRRGRDDASDGVKSVLSGLSWPLAAVMPVTLCGPAPCLVKRDGQNPVRSLTPLGPPSFGGIRDRQRPKRVTFGLDAKSYVRPKRTQKRTSIMSSDLRVHARARRASLIEGPWIDWRSDARGCRRVALAKVPAATRRSADHAEHAARDTSARRRRRRRDLRCR